MKNSEISNEKKIIATAFLILSAVYLSLVWNNNVWMDEAFTASLVHTDLAGVITRSMADTLPPLYNIILKLMTDIFGYRVPAMKITSVIPMILTLLAGATTVRKRLGIYASLLFMTLITFMPQMLYYGVEIRMYSMGFLFATLSGIWAYEIVCEPSLKNYAVFTVVSALAGYTHHFAFVTAAFAYLYLLLYCIFFDKKNIRKLFICLGGTFVFYLPCLIVTLKQISRVSGYFSMPDVDLPTFIKYARYPYTVGVTFASVLCLVLIGAALALFIYKTVYKKSHDRKYYYAICCFSVYYGVLIFGTVVSKIMTANIFVDRYLVFSMGLLWLFAAIVLSDEKKIFFAALAATIVIGACTYVTEYRIEYENTADEEIEFLRENLGEGDVLFCIGGHEEMENCIPFYTYLDDATPDITFVPTLENAIDTAQRNNATLWVAVFEGAAPSDEDQAVLDARGLRITKAADFLFDRYECEFCKVEQ